MNQFKEVRLREAEIDRGVIIKRALPIREKRMTGAWCFFDHTGPISKTPVTKTLLRGTIIETSILIKRLKHNQSF